MSNKTWTLKINEEELQHLIEMHAMKLLVSNKCGNVTYPDYSTETSFRIHDLTKRLNKKDEPEIETQDKAKTNEAPTGAWPTNG